jgi:uncharacterized protein YdaU (DUF1376 family)
MKPPAFQFYADDFAAGTCDLSAADVGAYIRLLCYQWSRGSVPINDPAKLARIAAVEPSADVLAKFPNGMNARMERERQKQDEYRAKQSGNGKAGAVKRWHGDTNGDANGGAIQTPMASGMARNSFPSPSPSPITIPTIQGAGKPPRSVFVPPLPHEVQAYAKSIGWPMDGQAWCDSYAQKGWSVGRNKMKDWKAAVRNWKSNKWQPQQGLVPARPAAVEGPDGWRETLRRLYPENTHEGAFSTLAESVQKEILSNHP